MGQEDLKILKTVFGFDEYLAGQERIISEILSTIELNTTHYTRRGCRLTDCMKHIRPGIEELMLMKNLKNGKNYRIIWTINMDVIFRLECLRRRKDTKVLK